MIHKPAPPALNIDDYKAQIQEMYEHTPQVMLNIALSHSKVVQDAPATIIGVYRNCFCVEERSTGTRQCHTFTYADLFTGRVHVAPRSS